METINENWEDKLTAFMDEAKQEGKEVWFDVDLTIIDRDHKTPLGWYLVDEGIEINVLTIGVWNKRAIEKFGFKVKRFVGLIDAAELGMADYYTGEDGTDEYSKQVNYLVDNEDQPLTKHLLKIGF